MKTCLCLIHGLIHPEAAGFFNRWTPFGTRPKDLPPTRGLPRTTVVVADDFVPSRAVVGHHRVGATPGAGARKVVHTTVALHRNGNLDAAGGVAVVVTGPITRITLYGWSSDFTAASDAFWGGWPLRKKSRSVMPRVLIACQIFGNNQIINNTTRNREARNTTG